MAGAGNGGPSPSGGPVKANQRNFNGWGFVLRFLAFALSFSAAVVLGVAAETTTVKISLLSSLPPVTVPVTAKWHYLSAFVYFVVINAIATAYAAISLVLTLSIGGGKKSAVAVAVEIADLVTVVLLSSAIGAAGAIGLMGYQGNSHVQWKKVCDVFGKFCGQGVAALVLSGASTAVFLLLVVISTLKRYNKG